MKHTRVIWWLAALLSLSVSCGDEATEEPTEPGSMDAGATDGAMSSSEGGAEAGGMRISDERFARVVSAPLTYAVAGERYTYRPRTNAAAMLHFSVLEPPAGMTFSDGALQWTPDAPAAGEYDLTIRGTSGNLQLDQQFRLTIARSVELTGGTVTEAGGKVFAEDGRAGISVPAGAVPDGVRLTVSELTEPPPLPNTVGRARALSFGPSGQVFSTPATITLPLPEQSGGSAPSAANLSALVWTPAGRWQRVQVLSVDLDNRVLTARARHFSVYVAAQSALTLNTILTPAGAGSTCSGSLLGQAELAADLANVSVDSINNLPEAVRAQVGDGGTVSSLLALPTFKGSLRIVQVHDLSEVHGASEISREQRLFVSTLYLPGDGSAVVTYADALGNVLAERRYPNLGGDALLDLLVRLSGSATAVRFASPADVASLALATRVHLLYFAGNAATDPLGPEDLGVTAADGQPVALDGAATISDVDCDGVLDAYDSTDDRALPRIEADPTALLSLAPNQPATLRARLVNGTVAGSQWIVMNGSEVVAGLLTEAAGDADARVFQTPTPGRYQVLYRVSNGSTALEQKFSIEVLAPSTSNTPPTCEPSKDVEVGRVGEPVPLTAVVDDGESPLGNLTVEWGLVPGYPGQTALTAAPSIEPSADRALFTPTVPGEYAVGCRAYDGQAWGPVGVVAIPMLAANANRAPSSLALTPLAVTVSVGDDYSLQASAQDPDGDPLSFRWTVNGAAAQGEATPEPGTSRLRQTAPSSPSKLLVEVAVTDGKSAEVIAAAEVVVRATDDAGAAQPDAGGIDGGTDAGVRDAAAAAPDAGTGGTGIDDDNDQWTDDVDCDDGDPTSYPGAPELCDGLDNDCDDLVDDHPNCLSTRDAGPPSGVDKDKDGVTVAEGDCNDSNFEIGPHRIELCGDGIDNDCDHQTDEACTPGADLDAGAPDAGRIDAGGSQGGRDASSGDAGDAGSSDWLSMDLDQDGFTYLGGDCQPYNRAVHPQALEVCDRMDNDCDGQIDEGLACGGIDGGVRADAGSPADAGDAGPADWVTHDVDGDGYTYAGGDCHPYDRAVHPNASEICDGYDNDCDGQADEGLACGGIDGGVRDGGASADAGGDAGPPVWYANDLDGDGYTYAGGDCHPYNAAVHPGASEICDGYDNDCDGPADEGLACGGIDGGVRDGGRAVDSGSAK